MIRIIYCLSPQLNSLFRSWSGNQLGRDTIVTKADFCCAALERFAFVVRQEKQEPLLWLPFHTLSEISIFLSCM